MSDKPKHVMHVDRFFGDGTYKFTLHNVGWDLLRELERKFDAGCIMLFREMYSGVAKVDVIREVVRLGLVGGGMAASEAHKLVVAYWDKEPAAEHAGLALEVLGAALFGVGNVPEAVS